MKGVEYWRKYKGENKGKLKKSFKHFIVSDNEEILDFQLAECSGDSTKSEGKGGEGHYSGGGHKI